jgi:cell wall-associated NlpC family hydrolase
VTILEVRVPVATMWTSPEAPRPVDAPAVADSPDVAAWAASVRTQELVGRTLTQLLLGEPARVLEERGAWVRCEALWQPSGHADGAPRDGYLGWLRRAHLAAPATSDPPAPATSDPPATTTSRAAPTLTLLSGGSCTDEKGVLHALSFGTTLRRETSSGPSVQQPLLDGAAPPTQQGRGVVVLPGGGRGEVSGTTGQPGYDAERVLELGRRFLGLGYLWGGTSEWGLDCSGLVHLTHRALGVTLPRDAADMAACPQVRGVPLDAVRPGDLYFFAKRGGRVTHVGFATRPVAADGSRWMLHAPEGGGHIEEVPMTDPRLASLRSAGRVHVPDDGQLRRSGDG